MSWWPLILVSLAAWRTFVVLARDKVADEVRDYVAPFGSPAREFIECPYCCGFWVSGVWVTAFCLWGPGDPPGIVSWMASWFACSALVVVVELAVDKASGE